MTPSTVTVTSHSSSDASAGGAIGGIIHSAIVYVLVIGAHICSHTITWVHAASVVQNPMPFTKIFSPPKLMADCADKLVAASKY
jgi:hypothetical protein